MSKNFVTILSRKSNAQSLGELLHMTYKQSIYQGRTADTTSLNIFTFAASILSITTRLSLDQVFYTTIVLSNGTRELRMLFKQRATGETNIECVAGFAPVLYFTTLYWNKEKVFM